MLLLLLSSDVTHLVNAVDEDERRFDVGFTQRVSHELHVRLEAGEHARVVQTVEVVQQALEEG